MSKKIKTTKKIALAAGAAALAALAPQAHAQSADALIDKLVSKGVLTVDEAKDLRDEADKDFKTAYQAKTGMPDWVTSYKIGGDFRGRYDQVNTTDNSKYTERTRFRFRLRFGIVANIVDNMEVGFRLATGDYAQGSSNQGNPVSGNATMQNNGTKKNIWIDAAYAKWTAINDGEWLLAATVGKMDNPFIFTPMIFDPDYTPEGAVVTGGYNINDQQALAFTGAAFVLDELGNTAGSGSGNSTQDPFMYGGQMLLNSTWTPKLTSTVGVGMFQIGSPQKLTTAQVPYQNQGNTRNAGGVLLNNYNPIIADANATYVLDSFPFNEGPFPIKVGGEFVNNPGAGDNNTGYWVGTTLGKSGKRRTWDLSYRYLYVQADATYDQLCDDDAVVYYQNAPTGGSAGTFAGTNTKGHMLKLNYSVTDSLTIGLTGYLTELIDNQVYNNVKEPNSTVVHLMADLMWKF